MKSLKSVLVILSAILLMCFILTSCDATEVLMEESTPVPTTVKIVPYTTEKITVDNDEDDEKEDKSEAKQGNSETNTVLNALVNSEDFKSNLKKAQKNIKKKTKLEAEVDGSTLVYKYTYVKQLSDSEIKAAKKRIDNDKLKLTVEKLIKNMVDKGYDDITVSFRYYNKDGELIKQADFDKSDLD